MQIKEKLKKVGSKVCAAVTGVVATVGTSIVAFAADGTGNEGANAAKSLLTQAESSLNITTAAEIIGAGIGAVLGLFVAWWGVRKLFNMLVTVFRKGKVKL